MAIVGKVSLAFCNHEKPVQLTDGSRCLTWTFRARSHPRTKQSLQTLGLNKAMHQLRMQQHQQIKATLSMQDNQNNQAKQVWKERKSVAHSGRRLLDSNLLAKSTRL